MNDATIQNTGSQPVSSPTASTDNKALVDEIKTLELFQRESKNIRSRLAKGEITVEVAEAELQALLNKIAPES